MPEDGFPPLSESRVAILGLGLMGGSLALALRGKCAQLLGIDPDPAAVDLALEREAVDLAATDAALLLPEADLIVLASPVRAILATIERLPGLHPGRPAVLDLGSTKVAICRALESLPARFDPLGGHPMCGKESGTLANAEAQLYVGAPFGLVALKRTTRRARALALELVGAAGGRALWLEAAENDSWTAGTSHLPYLLANTLAAVTPLEAAPMVGPGFRSTTRLAASPAPMMLDILATNRENVLEALARFRSRLEAIEALLAGSDEAGLALRLQEGAERQRRLLQADLGGGGRA